MTMQLMNGPQNFQKHFYQHDLLHSALGLYYSQFYRVSVTSSPLTSCSSVSLHFAPDVGTSNVGLSGTVVVSESSHVL